MMDGKNRNRLYTPLGQLTRAVARLAGAKSVDEVVEIVRTTARALVGCEGIAIIRRDGDLCHYIEEDAIGPLWKGQKFPMSACISGWAMLNKQTVVVPDIALDPRIPYELYEETFVRAVLMTPVRRDDPLAAIGAYWASTYEPSEEEIEVLEALASATATALENVRLISALKDAVSDAELMRDELRHRVKNAYMGAQSLARLTLPSDLGDQFNGRISALARVHELLDEQAEDNARIDLRSLIEIEIEPYTTPDWQPFSLTGPSVQLQPMRATALGLVINELATNALKHGALSVSSGRVEVAWLVAGSELTLLWAEMNGPAVAESALANQGSGLIKRLVERQLRGRLDHVLARSGVRCQVTFAIDAGVREDATSWDDRAQ
ncbi:HWE histidine kinase domain-containing protein [Neorhizobium sp. JUb45]|uniref:sensor histidine kinase n=1 Tax=unclassified Neorhizobium TaxID=2629175 RepID=UPI001053D8CD|nr:HWE histidine kinase domain-containing protein [Neorhizobium sp. JUb45]TCR00069.1 two-component sensor histidine kinase [Neorhizobium sp. JUb45]